MTPLEIATRVAWSYLGRPYRWGGDDPLAGFDCSGFVIEILKSAARLPLAGDWTAAGLMGKFPQHTEEPEEGCLVFWRNAGGRVNHVEYCLDATFGIGASGGRDTTTNVEAATDQNAYIKVRPFRSRAGLAGFVNPFKEVG
jgi:hypothetical protein